MHFRALLLDFIPLLLDFDFVALLLDFVALLDLRDPYAKTMSWLKDLMGFTSSLPNLFGTKGFVVVLLDLHYY
jgi:hypothetical protein